MTHLAEFHILCDEPGCKEEFHTRLVPPEEGWRLLESSGWQRAQEKDDTAPTERRSIDLCPKHNRAWFKNNHGGFMCPNYEVYGRRLPSGTVLQPTDVYESTSGSWSSCPCPGTVLEVGDKPTCRWVRPYPEPW